MSKKKPSPPKKRASTPSIKEAPYQKPPRPFRPMWGTAFVLLALLSLVGMADYDHAQNPMMESSAEQVVQNLVGAYGVQVSYWGFYALGWAAWLWPLAFLYVGFLCLSRRAEQISWKQLVFGITGIAAAALLIAQIYPESTEALEFGRGGLVGRWLYDRVFITVLGGFGTFMLGAFMYVLSLLLFLMTDPKIIFKDLKGVSGGWWAHWKEAMRIKSEEKAKRKEALAQKRAVEQAEEIAKSAKKIEPPVPSKENSLTAPPAEKRGMKKKAMEDAPPPEEVKTPPSPKSNLPKSEPQEEKIRIVKEEVVEKADFQLPVAEGDYIFPDLGLLMEPQVFDAEESAEEHSNTADRLKQVLSDFKLEVELGEVHTGPVITRYEVTPAPGVRVEKIANLDKNIAMSLQASGVRILAPVPGKGCVGVEVPNKKPQSVCIRDILESKVWANMKAEIPLALGKEVSGKPLVADLTKMPHLLIAGSTGSGKTVCINSIITSLLYHSSPEDLRFIMVDPKIVEMQVYNKLPHMLIPVVTDPKKVPGALKWLLNEMERRYHIFAKKGVRNIAGFNAKQAKAKEAEERELEMLAQMSPEERAAAENMRMDDDDDYIVELPAKLPYIVCIIDELADLMMVAPADIETGIARLAQLARAAGIHLIIATQRPSVNVITGVIKANLPSRIAFKVASKVDSRTILDSMGADALIGRGDMLMIPPGTSDLVRAQGAFVDDDEINNIVEYLYEKNGGPRFAEAVQAEIDACGDEDDDGGPTLAGDHGDDMIPRAIEVIKTTKRASTSMLQRKLKIGYNRAARIMDILEEEGLIGPDNGSSPREILMDQDEF